MFPPGCVPPGVFPAPDGSVVAQPVNILEWFSGFYAQARASSTPPVECITSPGDTLFVPQGWWHLVLNLEPDTVAITQNVRGRRRRERRAGRRGGTYLH